MAASVNAPGSSAASRKGTMNSVPGSVMQSTVEVDSVAQDEDWDWEARVSSITSSVIDYEYENGRRYHGFRAGAYPMPNDEKELDRLDIQHHVFTLALSGELYLAPLERPRRVLDIGTGTGLWAIEMAESHPESNVLGVDLSPVQPDLVPENAHFEIDDIESKWMYKQNYFDFVHSRIMIGAIRNWKKMLRRSFNHLKPGGWMEIQELDPEVTSDDGTHLRSPSNCEYNRFFSEASAKYGNPIPKHGEWKKMLEEAGFVDVRSHYFKLPMNTWPKDPRLKEVGKYQLLNYFEGYEAIGIGLFTRALGWTEPEFQVLLAKIRNELRDRSLHTYQYFTVVYGRKPPLSANSRGTTPSSATSSVTGLSVAGGPCRVRPPVPLFPKASKQEPSAEPGMDLDTAETTAKAKLAESPAQSVPGEMTFRINRNGEVIRLHQGETLQQHTDTFLHFTLNTNGPRRGQNANKGAGMSAPAELLEKMKVADELDGKTRKAMTNNTITA